MRGLRLIGLFLFGATLLGPSLSAYACVSQHSISQIPSCHSSAKGEGENTNFVESSSDSECSFCSAKICADKVEATNLFVEAEKSQFPSPKIPASSFEPTRTTNQLELRVHVDHLSFPPSVLDLKHSQSFTSVFLN